MTDVHPVFSADSAGVISVVGWGDPSNVWPGGTVSQPVDSELAPEPTGS